MKVPFILRLKWLRFRSWAWEKLHGEKDAPANGGWLIVAGIVAVGIMWWLMGCTPRSMQAPTQELELPASGQLGVNGPATKPALEPDRVQASATPLPSSTPLDPWERFSPPVEASAIAIRRPAQPHPNNDQLVTIMLLGSDQRPGEFGHRADVMMLVVVDPKAKSVKLLSIPRDLYVFIPGWRVDRINVADGRGGPNMVAETLLYNFGIELDHWVRVDFAGFTRAVDRLGGLEVEVTQNLSDYCGRYWSYSPGVYHMDGFQALCYVRMRKASSDFDRLRREQEVARALFKRVLSLDGLSRLPELVEGYQDAVETDLRLDDLMKLLPVALELGKDPARIQSYLIGTDLSTPWRVPASGASVVLPNWEAIGGLLERSFGLPEQSWR